ncbi:hypothetical protein JT359_17445 [Candidatus Poribacteria bacterium]|nr:hypothetical protein [Candidatus Poribacteria bacterium]
MKLSVLVAIAITIITLKPVLAHVTHHNSSESKVIQDTSHHEEVDMKHTSGQGDLKFKILYTRDHFPAEVVNAIDKAHGGFDVDRRQGKGETYFALPGVGIIQISADLKTVELIDTPSDLKKANAHYTTVWEAADGTPYLSFPANDVGRIFTTTLDGKHVHTLEAPDATFDFENQAVNTYFKDGGKFVPTGVTHVDGMLFVTTGYSDLDYILGVKLTSLNPFQASWYPLAFGGKGDDPGQFGTGHHITVPYGTDRLDISDRANAEIERYTTDGTYLETLSLIKGSFPCSIDYEAGYAVVASLFGPDREKGAPLYILEGDNLVSTVRIKDELRMETFQHLHGAVIRKIDGKFYIIVQSWNPGDIVILQQTQ